MNSDIDSLYITSIHKINYLLHCFDMVYMKIIKNHLNQINDDISSYH